MMLISVAIYTVSVAIPSSTTVESRLQPANAPRPAAAHLPEHVLPAVPSFSEVAESLRPGALADLPQRVQSRALIAATLTDKAVEPIRIRQEQERQAAIQRQAQVQQRTQQQAAAIAGDPAAAPVRLSSPIGPQEKWIDINLTSQAVTALIGAQPVHYALATTGAKGMETPTGEFHILYRVANETMTSASLGIPAEVENYRLENVLFTQYFTNEGHALHLNYWRPDYYFGNIPSSHGCAGLRYADAEYLWNFASIGTRIVIHY